MASPFPLSARDVIEFRPAQAAVIAARAALEEAQAETATVLPADGSPVTIPLDKLAAAQAALADAEAEQAKADPVYRLRVPTGRTKALVGHAVQCDPCAPRLLGNTELLAAIEAEAADAGLLEDDLAAIAEAKPLAAKGETLPDALWTRIFRAAQDTVAGRRIIADRVLYTELHARHRIAHHLLLQTATAPLANYRPLSEHDIDSIDQRYLVAINAELERLTSLSAADAKNSAAP